MSAERYEEDIQLLRDANLNTVHPFCVVERHCFYDLCDQTGMLVYQDFPMWLAMNNTSNLVRRATNQMRELVTQFGHHPSIFVWNCGSQPSRANFEKLGSALTQTARELDGGRIVQQANAIVDYRGTTQGHPVADFAWTEETLTDFAERFDWRIDTHQYFGWYYSESLEALESVPLKHLQLVSEYGAQALPRRKMLETIVPEDGLFPPAWPSYRQRCFQPECQFEFIGEPTSLDEFIEESQQYQARFIQHHGEYYRRHKFSPCNGAHLFLFNDCWPAITWSVVDYDREPKKGYFALQRAMAPVQALLEVAHRLPRGEEQRLSFWIVNDLPKRFDDLALKWKITVKETGAQVAHGEVPCSVGVNSLSRVGSVRWRPETSGEVRVVLKLVDKGNVIADNRYNCSVVELE
jgi:beta-mannosidase